MWKDSWWKPKKTVSICVILLKKFLIGIAKKNNFSTKDPSNINWNWTADSFFMYLPCILVKHTLSLLLTFRYILDIDRYEKSSRFMKVGYEREFLRYLQSLLAEVERRIRRGHARLALSQTQQSSGVSIKIINNHFAFFNSYFFTSLK